MSKGACQEQSEIREAAERASWWRRLPGLREALYESVIEPPGLCRRNAWKLTNDPVWTALGHAPPCAMRAR